MGKETKQNSADEMKGSEMKQSHLAMSQIQKRNRNKSKWPQTENPPGFSTPMNKSSMHTKTPQKLRQKDVQFALLSINHVCLDARSILPFSFRFSLRFVTFSNLLRRNQ